MILITSGTGGCGSSWFIKFLQQAGMSCGPPWHMDRGNEIEPLNGEINALLRLDKKDIKERLKSYKYPDNNMPRVVKIPYLGLILDEWLKANIQRPEHVIILMRDTGDIVPYKHYARQEEMAKAFEGQTRTIYACLKHLVPFSLVLYPTSLPRIVTDLKGFFREYGLSPGAVTRAFNKTYNPSLVHRED